VQSIAAWLEESVTLSIENPATYAISVLELNLQQYLRSIKTENTSRVLDQPTENVAHGGSATKPDATTWRS
jgi:hypothetical protein